MVVYAHPESQSLAGALLQAVVRGVSSAGHHVDVIDLYGEGFRAAMSTEEWLAYETDTPVLDLMVQRHIDMLLHADALVLVYPTWNMGLPAMLKGWFERIMVPGVAFTLDPTSRKVVGGLGHLQNLVGVTSYGMKRPVMFVANDAGRRLVTRCLRAMVPHRHCRTTWLGLYGLNQAQPARTVAFIGHVERQMAKI